jgi:hypothetical protein
MLRFKESCTRTRTNIGERSTSVVCCKYGEITAASFFRTQRCLRGTPSLCLFLEAEGSSPESSLRQSGARCEIQGGAHSYCPAAVARSYPAVAADVRSYTECELGDGGTLEPIFLHAVLPHCAGNACPLSCVTHASFV